MLTGPIWRAMADLPMLELDKFGWQQYPVLEGEELAEQCWRSDMIVSVDTPIDLAAICQQVVENINAYIRRGDQPH